GCSIASLVPAGDGSVPGQECRHVDPHRLPLPTRHPVPVGIVNYFTLFIQGARAAVNTPLRQRGTRGGALPLQTGGFVGKCARGSHRRVHFRVSPLNCYGCGADSRPVHAARRWVPISRNDQRDTALHRQGEGGEDQAMAKAQAQYAANQGIAGTIQDYVTLTKPGIQTLLLISMLGAMLVAADGVPSFELVLALLVGGSLTSGGANVLNCYIDRDIDARMSRTRRRATATGRISPAAALTFGVAISVVGTLVIGFASNWLAAGLAAVGNLYYVFIYTLWLKRSTPHNIVVGGAAGAVPPLVGWAAVTGS